MQNTPEYIKLSDLLASRAFYDNAEPLLASTMSAVGQPFELKTGEPGKTWVKKVTLKKKVDDPSSYAKKVVEQSYPKYVKQMSKALRRVHRAKARKFAEYYADKFMNLINKLTYRLAGFELFTEQDIANMKEKFYKLNLKMFKEDTADEETPKPINTETKKEGVKPTEPSSPNARFAYKLVNDSVESGLAVSMDDIQIDIGACADQAGIDKCIYEAVESEDPQTTQTVMCNIGSFLAPESSDIGHCKDCTSHGSCGRSTEWHPFVGVFKLSFRAKLKAALHLYLKRYGYHSHTCGQPLKIDNKDVFLADLVYIVTNMLRVRKFFLRRHMLFVYLMDCIKMVFDELCISEYTPVVLFTTLIKLKTLGKISEAEDQKATAKLKEWNMVADLIESTSDIGADVEQYYTKQNDFVGILFDGQTEEVRSEFVDTVVTMKLLAENLPDDAPGMIGKLVNSKKDDKKDDGLIKELFNFMKPRLGKLFKLSTSWLTAKDPGKFETELWELVLEIFTFLATNFGEKLVQLAPGVIEKLLDLYNNWANKDKTEDVQPKKPTKPKQQPRKPADQPVVKRKPVPRKPTEPMTKPKPLAKSPDDRFYEGVFYTAADLKELEKRDPEIYKEASKKKYKRENLDPQDEEDAEKLKWKRVQFE